MRLFGAASAEKARRHPAGLLIPVAARNSKRYRTTIPVKMQNLVAKNARTAATGLRMLKSYKSGPPMTRNRANFINAKDCSGSPFRR
jgi:hypothetical protein